MNLPGSPRGVRENLGAVLEALGHAVELLRGAVRCRTALDRRIDGRKRSRLGEAVFEGEGRRLRRARRDRRPGPGKQVRDGQGAGPARLRTIGYARTAAPGGQRQTPAGGGLEADDALAGARMIARGMRL